MDFASWQTANLGVHSSCVAFISLLSCLYLNPRLVAWFTITTNNYNSVIYIYLFYPLQAKVELPTVSLPESEETSQTKSDAVKDHLNPDHGTSGANLTHQLSVSFADGSKKLDKEQRDEDDETLKTENNNRKLNEFTFSPGSKEAAAIASSVNGGYRSALSDKDESRYVLVFWQLFGIEGNFEHLFFSLYDSTKHGLY